MPTLEDTFKMMLIFAMSSLKKDIEHLADIGDSTKDMLRLAWRMCLRDQVFWFGHLEPDDNMRFQAGVCAVYEWCSKHNEEDAKRIHAEFQALKVWADFSRVGGDVTHILHKLQLDNPIGLRRIWEEVVREVRVVPVLEKVSKQLEEHV